MGWLTPFLTWDPSNPEGVAGADFNRIEGNIDFLSRSAAVEDYDGRLYRTVSINGQQWTVDNWASTKYNDGTAIPEITDQTAWAAATTPAYCKYDNYITKYGLLYNFYVGDSANTKSVAPVGWRVPTNTDILNLITYLVANGFNHDSTLISNKLASAVASVNIWNPSSTTGAPGELPYRNNLSGFSAYPGGYRTNAAYAGFASDAWLWTSTERDASEGEALQVHNDYEYITPSFNLAKYYGMSLKMVRDI